MNSREEEEGILICYSESYPTSSFVPPGTPGASQIPSEHQ